jgi:peptide deformylase
MSLPILKYPDPLLRQKAEPVRKVNQKIKDLIEEMWLTMQENLGVGLASVQVGRKERLFVAGRGPYQICLVNPSIVKKTGRETAAEGCLSLPGLYLPIERARKVTIEGLSKHGKKIVLEEEGLFARAIQQELDHLEGLLIIDRVSREVLSEELERLENEAAKEGQKIDTRLLKEIRKEKGL